MYPVLFEISGLEISTHGVLAFLGIVFGLTLIHFFAKKQKVLMNGSFDVLILTILVGIAGARVTFFLLYRNQFASFSDFFKIWEGGLVSYGGFIPGGIFFYLYLKLTGKKIYDWLDIVIIGFFVSLFFGRLGDIMAGEFAGVPGDIITISGQIPIPLFEAFVCLLTGLLLCKFFDFRKKMNGIVFASGVFIYSFSRFIIDYWRAEEKLWLNLSLGQFVSLILIFFSGILIYTTIKNASERSNRDALKKFS